MAQNDNDERRQLMDRFLLETRDSPESAYFSEEEIVEIFDYANDFDNDFVRCEALMYGAAHYPESDALRVRRGFQYFYQGVDVRLIRQALVQVDPANTLGRILALRLEDDTTSDNIAPRLTALLESITQLDDEEAIQLIDLAADASATDWLIESKDAIIKRCSYLPTPLYEMGDVLYEAGRFTEAAAFFDELVGLEPFNIDFWCRLAETVAAAGDYDRALEAIDYAIAIDPDNRLARVLKARVLFAMEKEPEQIVSLLEPLVFDLLDPEHPDVLPMKIYVSTLSWIDGDNPDRPRAALEQANDILPANRELLTGLILTGSDTLRDRVMRYLKADAEIDSETVVALTEKLMSRGGPDMKSLAADVAEAYFSSRPTDPMAERMFCLLYMDKRYDDVIRIFEEFTDAFGEEQPPRDAPVNDPVVKTAYVMSRLRRAKGEEEKLGAMIELIQTINMPPTARNMQESLTINGMIRVLQPIMEYIGDHPRWRAQSLDRFDPFPNPHNTIKLD